MSVIILNNYLSKLIPNFPKKQFLLSLRSYYTNLFNKARLCHKVTFTSKETSHSKLEESSNNNNPKPNGSFHFISFGDLKSFIIEAGPVLR